MWLGTKLLLGIICLYLLMRVIDFLTHKRMNAGLVPVQGSDLVMYHVKDLPNKKEAAELLATTRKRLFMVIAHLKETPDTDIPPHLVDGIRRIVSKHCSRLEMNELDATQYETVAMNRKKGQEIHVCLRECPDCLDLTQADSLFMVALHEVAHSATRKYDPSVDGITSHGDEFKRYEYYLIQVAQGMGLIDSDSLVGTNYCGVEIPAVSNPQ